MDHPAEGCLDHHVLRYPHVAAPDLEFRDQVHGQRGPWRQQLIETCCGEQCVRVTLSAAVGVADIAMRREGAEAARGDEQAASGKAAGTEQVIFVTGGEAAFGQDAHGQRHRFTQLDLDARGDITQARGRSVDEA